MSLFTKNPKLFLKLNNGLIKSKYNTLDNYITWINDNKNIMNIDDLIDLIRNIYPHSDD